MQVAYALTQLVRTLTERSGGNGAVAVFMACYDCFCTVYASGIKQQARYAVGRCLMLWSSNDVTQQGEVALKQSYAAPTPMES